jgi:hypothetical protein
LPAQTPKEIRTDTLTMWVAPIDLAGVSPATVCVERGLQIAAIRGSPGLEMVMRVIVVR